MDVQGILNAVYQNGTLRTSTTQAVEQPGGRRLDAQGVWQRAFDEPTRTLRIVAVG